MQKTTADAMVNHPNAWFSWLKPAAAIEAAINKWQMVPKPIVAFSSLFPFFFPLLPTSSLITMSLFLEMLILLEHCVNNIKTLHSWICYWPVNQKEKMSFWTLPITPLSQKCSESSILPGRQPPLYIISGSGNQYAFVFSLQSHLKCVDVYDLIKYMFFSRQILLPSIINKIIIKNVQKFVLRE